MPTLLTPSHPSASSAGALVDESVVDLTADDTAGAFLAALRSYGLKALVFEYAGPDGAPRRVQPGYHVTEITDATLRSVDCGGGAAESWRETVVQVWDVPGGPGARHLTVDKFLGIWRAVDQQLRLDNAARLVVEVGDDVGAAMRYAATDVAVAGDAVVVRLGARRATCKPQDRWFAERGAARPVRALPNASAQAAAGACCTPTHGAGMDAAAAGAPCCS